MAPVIPVDLDDAALSVWADERLAEGDPVGAFVNRQLAGDEAADLLAEHGEIWLGSLAAWVVAPGRWERARLVGVELAGIDPQPLLDHLDAFPTVRVLDLGTHTPMTRERRLIRLHPATAQLDEVCFRMPHTWLVTARKELEHVPVPCFTTLMDHGELRFTRVEGGFALEARGHHPLMRRSVQAAQSALPIRSVVRVQGQ